MPTISMFYGIVIQIFWDAHAPPHFHTSYAEYKATVNIRELCIREGGLPRRATSWFLIGRNCIKQNCWLIGICAKLINIQIPLIL